MIYSNKFLFYHPSSVGFVDVTEVLSINPYVFKRLVSVSVSAGEPSDIMFLFKHTTHGSRLARPVMS